VSGPAAFLFYLLAYTLATMGAFASSRRWAARASRPRIEDYSGLWTVRPARARHERVPARAARLPGVRRRGFWAKWYMIQAALAGGARRRRRWSVALVLTSVLSAAYYLDVVA
jgi:NADH:ubiquinone oxidoreductase subunit 2 (subunit N)